MSQQDQILLLKESLEINKKNTSLNGEKLKENIEKLKSIKKLFSSKFNELINLISSIPDNKINQIDINNEDSPASIPNVKFWEWLYADNSTKKFKLNDDNAYELDGESGTINAYSSISFSSTEKLKIQFKNSQSFGCGGFGYMSMDDPYFKSGTFTSGSYKQCLICLCCSGTWGSQGMQTNGEAMQHRIKKSSEKFMTFEFNFEENLYKVYDCNDELFGTSDMNLYPYKENLVLIFYSGSDVRHSHEIIPI